MPASSYVPPGARTAGLALGLMGLLTGCPIAPSQPPDPPFAPDAGTVLINRDPACTLTGPLTISLGEGDGIDDFRPLEPGQVPEAHYGPQGGTHLLLGVRVANPAAGFPGMQVRFDAEAQFCNAEGCQPYVLMGHYLTVVEQDRYIVQSDGGIALSGFLVLLNEWPVNTRRRVTAEVIDRCWRVGTTSVEIASGTP
jgi:hypothetical protein